MNNAMNLPPTAITDLPADILNNISSHLTAAEFLSFTNCSRAFSQYREESAYWDSLTRRTFRLPVQQLPDTNQGLSRYKMLRTQLRLYVWGNLELETVENAGHKRKTRFLTVPEQPILADDIGIISDVQCGDHCAVILNSIGQLFILGSVEGRETPAASSPRQLRFPSSFPQSTKRNYEARTAIQQYSAGSSTVLGLADDGTLWSWGHDLAVRIMLWHSDRRFSTLPIIQIRSGRNYHVIHVKHVGLVYWPTNPDNPQMRMDTSREQIYATPEVLPSTSYHPRTEQSHGDQHHEPSVGEVTHYLALDDHIVFTTHHHKIYIYAITPRAGEAPFETEHGEPGHQTHLVDLTQSFTSTTCPTFQIRDLQCSRDRIAILTTSSELLIADIAQILIYVTYLSTNDSEANLSQAPSFSPRHIPAPQGRTITDLAFGASHWHIRRSDGTVASLGDDPSERGCLGLGGPIIAPFRGVQRTRSVHVSGHPPRFWKDARTVWFEPLKDRWAREIVWRSWSDESSRGASSRALLMIVEGHAEARKVVGDWFETEALKWENGSEAGSGAFFAVKIAAAGLHSVALVLVDEEKAEITRQKHVITHDQYVQGKKGIARTAYQIGHGMSTLGSRVLRLNKHIRYDWQQRGDVVPRLRMESGRVMPRQEEVAN